MLALSVATLYGVILSLLYGWGAEWLLLRISGPNDRYDGHFSITVLVGVALLSGLLGIWSFYWGVSTRALMFFSGLAICILVIARTYILNRLRLLRSGWTLSHLGPALICGAFSIYALYLASAGSPTYDVGLYHAQSIRWIEYFRVVPGLANLHERLGFNSSLFLLAAYWGFVGFQSHLYQVPGLIIVLSTVYFSVWLAVSRPIFAWLGGFVAWGVPVVPLLHLRQLLWLASPSTDLCAAAIVWVVFLLAACRIEFPGVTNGVLNAAVILLLSLFAVTLKLSTAPIMALAVIFLWNARAEFFPKWALVLSALAAIIVLPWLARNVLLTGYLLFPFYSLDLFSFDWKVPAQDVKVLQQIIGQWARSPDPTGVTVSAVQPSNWFPAWFRSLPVADLLLICASLSMPIWLAVAALSRRDVARELVRYAPVYCVGALGVAFWFIEAPTPRYGYGFLVPMSLFTLAPIFTAVFGSLRLQARWLGGFAQAALLILLLARMLQAPVKSWRHYLDRRHEYPVVETQRTALAGQPILVPVNGDQCWYAAFPCTPQIDSGLAMRGAGLQDGFYVRGR